MSPVKIVDWQEEDCMWLGCLYDYADYMTQGESLAELQCNLKDIYEYIKGGFIPKVKAVDE